MYKRVNSWVNLVKLESQILKFWEHEKIFEKLRKKNKDKPKWSFLDGPMTANNPMGVHHAWGRTLKDVYQRYWAMNGRELRYQSGFDCQGIWIEVEVEKELGFKSKRDIEQYGLDKFVNKCRERAIKYSNVITEQSKRLGFWMDWDNSYSTMSDDNNYTIWSFLKKAHEKNLIYKGNGVVPWCTRCGTGISQHEMRDGYKEIKHISVSTIFPIVDRQKEGLLVWTLTPWTLTSNVAVAVNPKSTYLKVKQGDWIYYISKNTAEKVFKEKQTWNVLAELKGIDLVGLRYTGPFDELPVQKNLKGQHHVVVPWDEVKEDEGTGFAHIASGCRVEDHSFGKKNNLTVLSPIDESGIFIDGYGKFTGKSALSTTKEMMQDLEKKNILYTSEEFTHSYPHCWRCNSELLFRLVDEWFIAVEPWREEIKGIAKQIKWIPSFGLDLELEWLNSMEDWMISKKRYWGLALPIWECEDCNSFEIIGSLEELKERVVEGWEQFEGTSPHRPWVDELKIICPKCGKKILRIKDIGNPWLDAGIVPYSTVQYNTNKDYWKEWIPADLVLECFPGQFRNWFYSLLATSTIMEKIAPFKTLVGYAVVEDENGEEMHKSKGNAIWFDDAAQKIGAELIRWIFCSNELTTNLRFGYKQAKLVKGNFVNTLWNSYSFFVNSARLINFKYGEGSIVEVNKRSDFDRWIIFKLNLLVKKCQTSFKEYDVKSATCEIENFVTVLSNWYIKNNRVRFLRTEMDEDTKAAFQTLSEVLSVLIKLFAPILPFLSEAMYRNIVVVAEPDKPESVHLTEYPVADESVFDQEIIEDMEAVISINSVALSARKKAKIKLRQPLSRVIISPNSEKEIRAVKRFSNLLKLELNVKEIELVDIKTECPLNSKKLSVSSFWEGWVAFDLD